MKNTKPRDKDKADVCRFLQWQYKQKGIQPIPFNELMEKSEKELTDIAYSLQQEPVKLRDHSKEG